MALLSLCNQDFFNVGGNDGVDVCVIIGEMLYESREERKEDI